MKIKDATSIVYMMTILLAVNTNLIYGQERLDTEPKKLDFLVVIQQSDSAAKNNAPLFDLRLELLNRDILNPEKVYVKIISKNSREIYFIRAFDRQVLSGREDVKSWEKNKAAKEEARTALRMKRNKTRKEKDKLWEGPRYEKQKGRSLQKIVIKDRKPALVIGPFSPGDYEVYVKVTDRKGLAWLDRHNITISPEVEESEKQEPEPGLIDLRN